jgi:large subunit ribosomal protein L30
MKKLEVELVRSVNGTPQWMRIIVRTLGLRKLRDKVVQPDNGAIRGMINKVPHLVEIREAPEGS